MTLGQSCTSSKMPRVQKLKDFLNSAADKFEPVDHVNHMNLLYINWSYSEFEEEGYQEAARRKEELIAFLEK